MDLSTCSFVVSSFARESAASLPGTLQWDGIHCRVTAWPLESEARAADRSLSSVSLFDWRACRMDKVSVRRTTFGEAGVLTSIWAAAVFRASASAL